MIRRVGERNKTSEKGRNRGGKIVLQAASNKRNSWKEKIRDLAERKESNGTSSDNKRAPGKEKKNKGRG